jgi:hypothetical protein
LSSEVAILVLGRSLLVLGGRRWSSEVAVFSDILAFLAVSTLFLRCPLFSDIHTFVDVVLGGRSRRSPFWRSLSRGSLALEA